MQVHSQSDGVFYITHPSLSGLSVCFQSVAWCGWRKRVIERSSVWDGLSENFLLYFLEHIAGNNQGSPAACLASCSGRCTYGGTRWFSISLWIYLYVCYAIRYSEVLLNFNNNKCTVPTEVYMGMDRMPIRILTIYTLPIPISNSKEVQQYSMYIRIAASDAYGRSVRI